MKKTLMTTVAVLAMFGFAGTAGANTPGVDVSVDDSLNHNSLSLSSSETTNKTIDSFNDKTITENTNKTIDSFNDKTITENTNKTIDSFNAKTIASNNYSYESRAVGDITKALGENSVAVNSTGAVNVTSTVLDVSCGSEGVLASGASIVNIATVSGNTHIDSVDMGSVGIGGGSGSPVGACDRDKKHEGQGAGLTASSPSLALSGSVADGVGLNAGNIYQFSNSPTAFAISGTFTSNSTRN
ncbi:MAG: hypothetical protein WCH05_10650 [Chlorobiaceae bacterium]